MLDKMKAVYNTLQQLNIPATASNLRMLLGCYQALEQMMEEEALRQTEVTVEEVKE